ncbi:MAG: diguanylate cyclase [Desulfobacteraceae bacterium]|nr:MAG: diguanylate cyclase [Desulfobacteraceae bacterium]
MAKIHFDSARNAGIQPAPVSEVRILIVEDSAIQSLMLKRILEKAGYDTAVARNGVEGLAIAKEYLPNLIISDIVMPEMDGFDLCRKIKSEPFLKSIPFVLLTSLKGPEDVIKGLSCEADDFITKPYQENLLLASIKQVLDNKSILSSRQSEKEEPIDISVAGEVYRINANRHRIIDFLLSAYETAVFKNKSLVKADEDLKELNLSLERLVEDRTSMLNQKIIELKLTEDELRKTTGNLKQSMIELETANKIILEDQQKVIEEERLTVLLQMAGATAHELNQPLTALLGFLELLNDPGNSDDEIKMYNDAIKTAGGRISDIVNKIKDIHSYETRPYADGGLHINFDQKINILSVEDSDADFDLLRTVLEETGSVIWTRAVNLKEALEFLHQGNFDLILIDYLLPDGNGFNFLEMLHKSSIETPVIVVTGQGDEIIASQIIRKGACDYLPKKGITKEILSRSVLNVLENARFKKEVSQMNDRLMKMATIDDLTGLYNRRYFMDALKNEVIRHNRYGHYLVLCMMDLDHFKSINDTYGHSTGDMVLRETGRLIKECFRNSDIVCRYGGEEFMIILPHTPRENARLACERFREKIATHPFKDKASGFRITISTGVAQFSKDVDATAEKLIERADEALYQAKNNGRNRVEVF